MQPLVDPEHGFSFGEAIYPAGGIYGPLSNRYVNLLMMQEGRAKVTYDDETIVIQAGQCGFIRNERFVQFEYEKSMRSKVSWCEGYPTLLPESEGLRLPDVASQIPISERLQTLQRLGLELGETSGATVNILRNALGQTLFTAYFHESQRSERERHIPLAIHRARQYLEDNFEIEITVDRLAKIVALTPQHLISSFRKHLGMTPIRYLWKVRANRGHQLLLRTGLTIAEITFQCGYKNSFHFSRQIKQQFGMSPTEVRATMGYRKPSEVAENTSETLYSM
jgi:AraC-like DNA-binding protein